MLFQTWLFKTKMSQFAHWSIIFCICPNRIQQKSIRIFIQTSRIMVAGAKSNSHDSGSHFKKLTFKNGCQKKSLYIFAAWVAVASKNWHAVFTQEYTSTGMKIWTFLKNNRGMRLKLSSAPLRLHSKSAKVCST